MKSLPVGRKSSFYISMYMGLPVYENRSFFFEVEEKREAIREFLRVQDGFGHSNTIVLSERIGSKVADKTAPYMIEMVCRQMAIKNVPIGQ